MFLSDFITSTYTNVHWTIVNKSETFKTLNIYQWEVDEINNWVEVTLNTMKFKKCESILISVLIRQ